MTVDVEYGANFNGVVNVDVVVNVDDVVNVTVVVGVGNAVSVDRSRSVSDCSMGTSGATPVSYMQAIVLCELVITLIICGWRTCEDSCLVNTRVVDVVIEFVCMKCCG